MPSTLIKPKPQVQLCRLEVSLDTSLQDLEQEFPALLEPEVKATFLRLLDQYGFESAHQYLIVVRNIDFLPATATRRRNKRLPKGGIQPSRSQTGGATQVKLTKPKLRKSEIDLRYEQLVLGALEPGERVTIRSLFDYLVPLTDFILNINRVRDACNWLFMEGVVCKGIESKMNCYWLPTAQEKQFSVDDPVVECPGTSSQRYGTIERLAPHPHHSELLYPIVQFQDGSVAFSSPDLLFHYRGVMA